MCGATTRHIAPKIRAQVAPCRSRWRYSRTRRFRIDTDIDTRMDTRPTRDHPALRERDALQLLRVAMGLPDSARDAFLQGECSDDTWLLQRVRDLLACADEPDSVATSLDGSVPGSLAVQASVEQLGPWRLLRSLGRGGMGEVWLAERADGAFQRQVAIKRIRGGATLLATRFLRERSILARLQHPHIASLIDGGLDDAGHPWFAMEYVSGQRIDRWCDARRTTLYERVGLIIQLCRAVQFAHGHLIVHRDIKPANVLVGDDGAPKLLDFGIARMLDEAEPTQTQWLMTPAYAAPEQRRGEAPSTATDVYQLGLLLRELLIGSNDHAGCQRLDADYAACRRTSPSQAQAIAQTRSTTPDALASQLRGDLASIVALATAESADARYASPAALADDLQRWQLREPVRARADERGYRLRRMLRRRWPWLATAAAAVLFAGYHVHSLDLQLQRTQAEHKKSQAIAGFLVSVFRSAPPGQARDSDLSARELLRRSTQRLQNASSEAPAVRAALLVSAAKIYRDQGLIAESLEVGEEAVRLLRAERDTSPDARAEALLMLAKTLYLAGQPQRSLASAREALAALEDSPAQGSALHGEVLGFTAMGLFLRKDPVAAAMFSRALAILAPHRDRAPLPYIEVMTNAAYADQLVGRLREAEQRYQQARELSRSLVDTDPRAFIGISYILGTAVRDQGRLDESLALLREAKAAARRHYGEHHDEVARDANAIALTLLQLGRLEEAAREADEAVAIAQRVFGESGYLREYRFTRTAVRIAAGDLAGALADLPGLDSATATESWQPLVKAAVDCLQQPSSLNRLALNGIDATQFRPASLRLLREWQASCNRAVDERASISAATPHL